MRSQITGLWARPSAVALLGLAASAGPLSADDDLRFMRVDQNFGAEQPPMFVADEFIVVLTPEARGGIAAAVDPAGRPAVNIRGLQDVIDEQGVTRFARQFPTAQPQPEGGRFRDLTGYYKVKIVGKGGRAYFFGWSPL